MKKRALTWLRPTADNLHIWNYFWAVKPLIDFQNSWEYDIVCFVADLHWFITIDKSDKNFKLINNIIELVKFYICAGLDYKKIIILKQSDNDDHLKFFWILNCITNMGSMKRMHSYKDFVTKLWEEWLNMWIINYPILMASDILLYWTDIVPVWKDQKQHVEFARDIAIKFNNLYWDILTIPQPLIKEDVAIVPWIDWRKMSKSYKNFIGFLEDEKTILKKVKLIVTQEKTIEESKNPDECNIYNILKLFLPQQENNEVREKYINWWLKYSDVKQMLYEKIIDYSKSFKEKYQSLDEKKILEILNDWAQKSKNITNPKIEQIYKVVWFK